LFETSQKGSPVKFVRRVGKTMDNRDSPDEERGSVGTLRSILNQAHIDLNGWDKLS